MKTPSFSGTTDTQVSLEVLAAAINSAQDSVIITNIDLEEPGPAIVYVNTTFTQLTGYTAAEVIGRNPRFLQGPKTDRRVLDDIRNKLSNNAVFVGKAVNYRKDGSTFINEWHIEPIVTADGRMNHYLAIQRDVTERERMYERLIESEQQLRLQAVVLEDKNQALHELLQQIDREKQKVKEDVSKNIEEVLLPVIRQLKRKMNHIDDEYLILLESSLRSLNSSFGRSLIEKNFNLSPREVEIANMIRQGVTTKGMALILSLSTETVESHRKNIRKKLGITNSDSNLTSYLQRL